VIDVEDKTCPCCRGSLHLIGENKTEMLDYVSEHVRVLVIRRPSRTWWSANTATTRHCIVSGFPSISLAATLGSSQSHEDRATTD